MFPWFKIKNQIIKFETQLKYQNQLYLAFNKQLMKMKLVNMLSKKPPASKYFNFVSVKMSDMFLDNQIKFVEIFAPSLNFNLKTTICPKSVVDQLLITNNVEIFEKIKKVYFKPV